MPTEEVLKKYRISFTFIGIILSIIIGIIDYATGYELLFSIFYLMPLYIVTWKSGKYAGILIAVIAAALMGITNFLAGKPYASLLIPYWNFIIRTGMFVVVVILMSKLKYALSKEKLLARKDFVTDIANWQAFSEVAKREIERSRRYNRPLSIAYIDCDNFKSVNDTLGHGGGDAFLRSIADAIQNNIRAIDIVARLGGDEFAILFPETGGEEVKNVIKRLQNILISNISEVKHPLTYSIGIATFMSPPNSVEEMVKESDGLMYIAKRNGKNMIQHGVFNYEKNTHLQNPE